MKIKYEPDNLPELTGPDHFVPYRAVGDGTNDDIQGVLKAQIAKLKLVDGMDLRVYLSMLDGSVPENLELYQACYDIFGNHYRADFRVEGGIAFASWTMGKDGWWFDPTHWEEGEGRCHVYVGRKDGELHSEVVMNCGWFSVPDYGHAHADLSFVMEPDGTEPPEPPPPPPPPPPEEEGFKADVLARFDIMIELLEQIVAK